MVIFSSVVLVGCSQSAQELDTKTPTVQNLSGIDWTKTGPDAKKFEITFSQIKHDVESGKAVFLDVRSLDEFESKNFGITENYPITELEQGKLPDIEKDTKIYVHCLKGIRSAQAVQILREAGFTEVYDMGGIEHVQAVGGVLK